MEYLGGRVKGLVENWEKQEELNDLIRFDATVAAGRPPFIPFSQVIVFCALQALNDASNLHSIGRRDESEDFVTG